MLNNYFRRIFVRIKADKTNIRFSVPFISVMEPVNDLVDLLNLVGVVMPQSKDDFGHNHKYPFHQVTKVAKMIEILVWELTGIEPFDMIDIDTKDTTVHIGIR